MMLLKRAGDIRSSLSGRFRVNAGVAQQRVMGVWHCRLSKCSALTPGYAGKNL